jgi:NADPH-dependent glutamate synthase beta subunit-like oxidoreductase
MKLDKSIVQRRLDLMAAEGIVRITLPWFAISNKA